MLYFLFSVLVYFFGIFINILNVSDYVYEYSCDGYDKIAKEYDYIVVGAGTAGSIIALRLAENRKDSVLLIESGPDTTFPLNIPAVGPMLQRSKYDWGYKTEPQENACLALKNNRSSWPLGRLVGGTAALNNLVYLRARRGDVDGWAAAGCRGWAYGEDALRAFRRAEDQRGRYANDTLYHGRRGLNPVSDLDFTTALGDAFVAAGAALGFPVGDLNAGLDAGFMHAQVNTLDGARFTVGSIIGRLSQQQLPNLRLLTRATVDKVLFGPGMRARGVLLRRLGGRLDVGVRKAVVLSAGAVGSPAILMRSGVGPAQHLHTLGIPVLRDLPVGEGLADHVATGLDLVLLDRPAGFGLREMLSVAAVSQYFLNATGPWTFPGAEAVALTHSSHSRPGADPPDLLLMALPAGASTDGGAVLRRNLGINDATWDAYFRPLIGRPVASLLVVLLRAQSRGHVRLRTRSPFAPPRIDPRYLTTPRDLDVLLQGLELVKQLVSTPAMRALGARLNPRPFPGCEAPPFDSPAYWTCYVRMLTLTAYHPVGTCSMGVSPETSVVSPSLSVHGTRGLHVADASILPWPPSSNPAAVVAMVAERAATLVRSAAAAAADRRTPPPRPHRACVVRDFFLTFEPGFGETRPTVERSRAATGGVLNAGLTGSEQDPGHAERLEDGSRHSTTLASRRLGSLNSAKTRRASVKPAEDASSTSAPGIDVSDPATWAQGDPMQGAAWQEVASRAEGGFNETVAAAA